MSSWLELRAAALPVEVAPEVVPEAALEVVPEAAPVVVEVVAVVVVVLLSEDHICAELYLFLATCFT